MPKKQYPAPLSYADAVLADAMAKIGHMMKEPPSGDPEEVCKKFWSVLRAIYVANAADAERIDCQLADDGRLRDALELLLDDL